MVLSELPKGVTANIHSVIHPHRDKQIQLLALGFDPGESVQLMMKAPFGNPLQVKVGATLIAIHTDDAQYIQLCEGACEDYDE
ncbi:ferrous iron transport protein A [Marinomonas rhizomae]|uniref:Ferrous iron transport protein A n=1 Tax=Marinomonas rhizomae TaxID=491948 RepID=A0A366J411_9GAMM|nr:FeoA family protein [Marinomonas rhizomae]RBP81130.1 ferrous iron transport protein A [Marinomonas rhizomae]RNF72288.1 ferrous iron transport protein A [Marinomonas rhizomae]